MTQVRVESFTISLDGFGAGPNQSIEDPLGVGGEELHEWFIPTRTFQRAHGTGDGTTGVDDEFATRGFRNIGAWRPPFACSLVDCPCTCAGIRERYHLALQGEIACVRQILIGCLQQSIETALGIGKRPTGNRDPLSRQPRRGEGDQQTLDRLLSGG